MHLPKFCWLYPEFAPVCNKHGEGFPEGRRNWGGAHGFNISTSGKKGDHMQLIPVLVSTTRPRGGHLTRVGPRFCGCGQ